MDVIPPWEGWELYIPIIIIGELMAFAIVAICIKHYTELSWKKCMGIASLAILSSFCAGLIWWKIWGII